MKIQDFSFEALTPPEMAAKAEDVGVVKATKEPLQAFYLAIMAGVFISIAFVFYTTVTTGAEGIPYGIIKTVGGLFFSLGLILVVVCGGELFTSSVLTTVACASGRISVAQLLKNWGVVYLGNFFGAAFFVAIIWFAQQHMIHEGAWGINALRIASHKLQYSFSQAVALGILCNLLVCLATWMTFSCRSTTDKILVMILPVSMFVASGFEHSIANMFMIPLGIVIKTFASPEFWVVTGQNPAEFAELTVNGFVFRNLIPVTLGNIIGGGLLVGMTNWVVHRRKKSAIKMDEKSSSPENA